MNQTSQANVDSSHPLVGLRPVLRAVHVAPLSAGFILFEGGAGETVRPQLLKQADVHTLLRLPTGIFYAQGVKANVLFFDRKPAQENRSVGFECANARVSSTRPMKWLLCLTIVLFVRRLAFAYDDAEILSRRVPDQYYLVREQIAALDKGKLRWFIPLWSCDPADLKIVKVLGKSPPAPYAIEITVGRNERIDALDNVMRLQSIHLLAASLGDAVKMRRALMAEISAMQRDIEKRQGYPPGYLKRLIESQRRSRTRQQ